VRINVCFCNLDGLPICGVYFSLGKEILIMRNAFSAVIGAGLLVVPTLASAQVAVTPPIQSAGIWTASASTDSPTQCSVKGTANGYQLTISADTQTPNFFEVSLNGPNLPQQPASATLIYGAGLSQTLTGNHGPAAGDEIDFLLDNSSGNNFATFLHGFTAGTEMSVIVGSVAMDFSLAGTSAVVGALGQCTDAKGFNSLPAPWRPASAQPIATPVYQPTAPVTYTPPAPTAFDIYASDGSFELPDCNDPQSSGELESTVEGMQVNREIGLRVFSVDRIFSETTTSGRQLCHASVFTSQGPQNYDFQWLAHNGQIYMYAQSPRF
jgi:hypothetical protein